ncbi:MAG TPA: PAS domain S-box protein [Steroidobacteraceae bacterium]
MAIRRSTRRNSPRPAHTSDAASIQRDFLATIELPAMALDGRGRLVEWNRACERLTGYTLAELSGSGWRKLFPDAAEFKSFQRERARHVRAPFKEWTWRICTARGEIRYVQWRAVTGQRAPQGAPVVRAIGQDVTELHAARKALDVTDEFLHIAQQTARFGAWSFDPHTRSINYTPELEEIYGVSPGRFGRRYTDFTRRVYPEDLQRIEPIRDRAVAARQPFEYEIRILDPDGRTRWINIRGRGLHAGNGRLLKIVGIDTDVTEQVQTRLALAARNADLDAILRSEAVTVFHQDRELRYTTLINPVLGMRAGEALGKTDEEILGKAAADAVNVPKRRVLRTGRGERLELEVQRGALAGWFDLIIEPERDANGKVTGIVCAAIDISRRKEAQRALEQTNGRLRELAAHLQESIEDERIAVARDVHDQVGATLTAMRMRLTSLAGRVPSENTNQRAELLSIAALAEAAMHATRDICSRLRPPALEDIGLAQTCRWYLREWSQTTHIRATGRFPRHACGSSGLVASTDLFRILQELLTNVARHSGARQVRVTLACTKKHVRLRVQDDGQGFDSGAPADGFGLAGVRERARHHGGRVDIHSGAQGTTVDVMIPFRGKP